MFHFKHSTTYSGGPFLAGSSFDNCYPLKGIWSATRLTQLLLFVSESVYCTSLSHYFNVSNDTGIRGLSSLTVVISDWFPASEFLVVFITVAKRPKSLS